MPRPKYLGQFERILYVLAYGALGEQTLPCLLKQVISVVIEDTNIDQTE
jgi:hypothetical protein